MSGALAVEVDPLLLGELSIPHAYVFRPEGGRRLSRLAALVRPEAEPVRSPCVAYAVRHPSAGVILVDTGLHPEATRDLRKDFGPLLGLVFRGLRPADLPFDQQLRELEIEPREVDRVVMTHLHVDHTSGMRLLPRAEFTCSREEWAAATERGAARNGYASHHLPPAARMCLVDFDVDGESHGPFGRTVDLLGDGSIRLVSTPGHTRGHLSVLLRLEGERQALLVGDAAYTLRSIDEQRLPLFTAGDGSYRRSLREIKAYADGEPAATLVPSHDPSAWRALSRVSAAAG